MLQPFIESASALTDYNNNLTSRSPIFSDEISPSSVKNTYTIVTMEIAM